MYKNYIFDLYGTLIDIRTDEEEDVFWEKITKLYCDNGANYTETEIKEAYGEYINQEKQMVRRLYPEYEYIDVNLEKVFYKLYENKGVNASHDLVIATARSFREYSTKKLELYDGVVDLLKSLKEKGKKVYLLSNAQRCFTYNEIVKTGIVDYFDGIMISSDVMCSKPDKNFYYFLLENFKLKKSESIMIGNDYISDIRGAHSVGIDSLYIHQEISPEIKGKLYSKWSVMDGDVYKIKEYVLK